ncbi:MAG: polyprenyl synthetase family protein [Desulfobacterales bacterium]
MTDLKARILAAVQEDLAAIETALKANLKPHLDLVGDVAGHLLFSGGKRFRPLLALLSTRLCGYSGPDAPRFSVIFEYLHAATLLHDDVVDGARLRRGRPVAHKRWESPIVVLTGDFLLARSLSLAAATGNCEVIATIAEITENMSQGEIDQLARKGQIELSEAAYYEVIRRKTAVLFQGACRAAAIFSGSPPPRVKALADYGFHLGMAFQIVDDLLDYTGRTQTLGKQVGADLREGKLTLPVIYTLARASAADRRKMVAVIENREFSPEQFQTLCDLLVRYGGLQYSRQKAAEHGASAQGALEMFPGSASREILGQMVDYALVREQ